MSDNSYFQIGYSGDYQPQGLEAKNIQIQSNLIFAPHQVNYPVYLEEWAKDTETFWWIVDFPPLMPL